MKKLYLNIILFLLPLLVIVALLPTNKRSKYLGLKNDCFNHGIWIHDRIFENMKTIDIAILGSSHTINGFNDEIIENELNKYNTTVVNFGYCRLGRNLNYTLIKEILQEKQPKYIVLEIRNDEDRYSHPIFPYISNTTDVLFPNPLYNRDLVDDIFTHLSYKVELTQDMIFQKNSDKTLRLKDFGYSSFSDTASIQLLDSIKQTRAIPDEKMMAIKRNFYMKFPRVYLNKISKLCKHSNINLLFVYLPSYGQYLKQPKEYSSYLKYGEVLIPPKEILQKQFNWYDENHLNQAGGKELSIWLSKKIAIKIDEQKKIQIE